MSIFNRSACKAYAVVLNSDPDLSVTVTQTKSQAEEFIQRKIKLEYFNHFKAWCKLRCLDSKSELTWKAYWRTLTPEEKSKYKIVKIDLPYAKLLAIVRAYCKHIPIGCSYDDDLEYDVLFDRLDESLRKEIEDEIEEEMQEEKHYDA